MGAESGQPDRPLAVRMFRALRVLEVKSGADAITTAVAELGRTVSSVTVSNADAAPHTVLWGRIGVAYPASVGRVDGTRLGPRELGRIKESQLLQVLPLEQGHTVAKRPATDPRLAAH